MARPHNQRGFTGCYKFGLWKGTALTLPQLLETTLGFSPSGYVFAPVFDFSSNLLNRISGRNRCR
jgi:hypothetical protein